MKWFVIVVIVAAISLKVNGLNMTPNIKFKFKQLIEAPIVEYEAEIIRATFSNLEISEFYVMKLKTITYLKDQHRKLLWSIEIIYNKKCECERQVEYPLYNESNMTKEMELNYQNQKENKHEILAVLTFNYSIRFLVETYGCKNSDHEDKIHKNEITLILYKNIEPLNVKVFNQTFVVYAYILGYLQIINKAIENNSVERNEEIFYDIIHYCEKNANNINHVSSFDDLYSDVTIKNPKNVWLSFIVSVVIVLTILVLTTSISTFCNDDM